MANSFSSGMVKSPTAVGDRPGSGVNIIVDTSLSLLERSEFLDFPQRSVEFVSWDMVLI